MYFTVLKQTLERSIGKHLIYYKAYLTDYPQVKAFYWPDPFVVTIVEPIIESNFTYNEAPEWLTKLEDQYLTLGDNLFYNFGEKTNIFDEEVSVTVTLQTSLHFASYDSFYNSLVVIGDKMFIEDIGAHKVKVEITYTDPKG